MVDPHAANAPDWPRPHIQLMIERVSCANVIAVGLLGMAVSCGSKSESEGVPAPPPASAKPKTADAAVGERLAPPGERSAPIAEEEAAEPYEKPDDYSTVLAQPDPWKGPRTRYKTAVLLIAPRPDWKPIDARDPPAVRGFQPVVCAIEGVRATGARCGEIMPAHATIRTPAGELAVERSKKPFHDNAGEHTYPAPYGPACCMYNTCIGKTVPYTIAHGAQTKLDQRTVFAVWPADADIELEIAGDGLVGVPLAQVPKLQPDQQVVQAFVRAGHKYASVSWRSGGGVEWDLGTGWVTAGRGQPGLGPRGFKLLATTDVDHDGHPELVSYEIWANDYGLDVYGDSDPKPIYDFSCGNI